MLKQKSQWICLGLHAEKLLQLSFIWYLKNLKKLEKQTSLGDINSKKYFNWIDQICVKLYSNRNDSLHVCWN